MLPKPVLVIPGNIFWVITDYVNRLTYIEKEELFAC